MYTPKKFKETDSNQIREFIDQNGFGIIISLNEQSDIETTFTPMFVSDDLDEEIKVVFGHIARANPQWKSWKDKPKVKLLFSGPHTYISPRDYDSAVNVPTWNYTAVAIEGNIQIVEDPASQELLIDRLVSQYESSSGNPWRLDKSEETLMNLFRAIVCFEVKVEHVEAKFKLNQNKSAEDQQQVVERLQERGGEFNRAIASLMRTNQTGKG